MKVHDLPGQGPAFPSEFRHDTEGNSTCFAGITVRDYLIAHAPDTPQRWFQPVTPPCPSPLDVTELKEEFQAEVASAMECFTDPPSAEAAAWMAAHSRRAEQIGQWHRDRETQRWLQWPAAWADEQLKLRAAWLLANAPTEPTHD